jgi:AraC-like DNA-binding protein
MSEEKILSVALDRHLSIAEIAQQWGVSKDTVRRHFESVPGVLRLGHRETKAKRRYFTVRVPERIVRAQHALLTKAVSS